MPETRATDLAKAARPVASVRHSYPEWGCQLLPDHSVRRIDLPKHHIVAPEIGQVLEHALGVGLIELGALDDSMAQHQATIAGQVNIDHLDVGIDEADVVLLGQFPTDTAVAPIIMDRIDLDTGAFLRIIVQMEHAEVSHQAWAEELTDEVFVAIVGPDIAQHRHHVTGSGDVGKPLAILIVGI